MKLQVSIVVLTYNRVASLQKCLTSIFEQEYRDFEVILLDKGSSDGTQDLIKDYPLRYIIENNGLVAAYNRGIKEAQGKIVAILDDDIILDRNWLKEIVSIYSQMEEVGAVGGRQLLHVTDKTEARNALDDSKPVSQQLHGSLRIISRLAMLFLTGHKEAEPYKIYGCGFTLLGGFTETEKPVEVDFLNVNMTFSREALERINGFDLNFNVGHGDYAEPDLCLRLREMKYKIILNPKALIYHEVSMLGVPRGIRERIRNFIYFYRKWKPEISDGPLDSLRFLVYLAMRSLLLLYFSRKPGEVINGIRDGYSLRFVKGGTRPRMLNQ